MLNTNISKLVPACPGNCDNNTNVGRISNAFCYYSSLAQNKYLELKNIVDKESVTKNSFIYGDVIWKVILKVETAYGICGEYIKNSDVDLDSRYRFEGNHNLLGAKVTLDKYKKYKGVVSDFLNLENYKNEFVESNTIYLYRDELNNIKKAIQYLSVEEKIQLSLWDGIQKKNPDWQDYTICSSKVLGKDIYSTLSREESNRIVFEKSMDSLRKGKFHGIHVEHFNQQMGFVKFNSDFSYIILSDETQNNYPNIFNGINSFYQTAKKNNLLSELSYNEKVLLEGIISLNFLKSEISCCPVDVLIDRIIDSDSLKMYISQLKALKNFENMYRDKYDLLLTFDQKNMIYQLFKKLNSLNTKNEEKRIDDVQKNTLNSPLSDELKKEINDFKYLVRTYLEQIDDEKCDDIFILIDNLYKKILENKMISREDKDIVETYEALIRIRRCFRKIRVK